jgi:hypothetical protein
MNRPPAFLTYDGAPVAEPCFRTLAWFAGSLNDAPFVQFASDLAGWFWRGHGARIGRITAASDLQPPVPRDPTPETMAPVLADVGRWIKDTGKPYSAYLQMEAPQDLDFDAERVPWLHLREGAGMVLAEVCLPHDLADLVAQADALAGLVARDGLICALQGMGYFLPPMNRSLKAVMPRATVRYPAAIELQLLDPVDGLQVDGAAFYWEDHPDLQPGLPDIGWRTMLGAGLAARLDAQAGKLPDMPGVTVTQGPLTLTAGPAPVWGDVNRAEDISAYRAVAAALAPLAMPREVTDSRYFAGNPDDADHMDRLDAYLARFA